MGYGELLQEYQGSVNSNKSFQARPPLAEVDLRSTRINLNDVRLKASEKL